MAAYVILYATEVIDEELHAEFRRRAPRCWKQKAANT